MKKMTCAEFADTGGTRKPVKVSVLVSRLHHVCSSRLSSSLAESSWIQAMRGYTKLFLYNQWGLGNTSKICGRNYSFVPVYSENAPHRLPCHEFLMGVLVRASPYMKIMFPWILAFLLNTYCYFLHPWFRETAAAFQADFGISSKSAFLLSVLIYNALIVYLVLTFTLVRRFREELLVNRFPHRFHAEILIENGLGQSLVSRVAHVLCKYKKILCYWYHSQLHNFLGDPPRLVDVALHEFGAIGQLLFFLDDNIYVISGLLGLLIDLMIIIPSRVPVDKTPFYFLTQDWLIGVVVLHIWTFLTMLTSINCFATKAWRVKFNKIRNMGINRLLSMWLLREVIGSMLNTLLTTLSIPYLLLKSLFPLLGYSHSANPAIERFIWPVLLALIAIWFMAKQTYALVIYLHWLVFNDRYIVGERVDDFNEDKEQGLIYGV